MANKITVEQGLVAHFKQASGPSRLGVDWVVQITGERSGMVMVRTYFSSDPPRENEKSLLAETAAYLVRKKLEEGWIPEPGSMLQVAPAAPPSSLNAGTKPWWRFW